MQLIHPTIITFSSIKNSATMSKGSNSPPKCTTPTRRSSRRRKYVVGESFKGMEGKPTKSYGLGVNGGLYKSRATGARVKGVMWT